MHLGAATPDEIQNRFANHEAEMGYVVSGLFREKARRIMNQSTEQDRARHALMVETELLRRRCVRKVRFPSTN
jgi:hypothetical protein